MISEILYTGSISKTPKFLPRHPDFEPACIAQLVQVELLFIAASLVQTL